MIPRLSASGPVLELLTAPVQTFHHDAGATVTIDWSKGNNQQVDLTAASAPCVVTSVGLPDNETAELTLLVQQDATGSRTIAFANGSLATGFALAATGSTLLRLFWTGHTLLVSVGWK